ncbi:MAG: hypothetical protein K5762_06620, partial [Bacilli bacterium]|nr:hypothetical protein [Bacilli bacterium]
MKKAKSLLIGLVSILFPLTSCGVNTGADTTVSNVLSGESSSATSDSTYENFRDDENTQGLKYVLLEDETYAVGGDNAKELSEIIIPSQFHISAYSAPLRLYVKKLSFSPTYGRKIVVYYSNH